MSAFELTLSVPADERYADTLLALAEHSARHAGCDEPATAEFIAAIDDAWRGCLRGGTANQDGGIAIVLRLRTGELEAIFTCGRTVRVAHALPLDV